MAGFSGFEKDAFIQQRELFLRRKRLKENGDFRGSLDCVSESSLTLEKEVFYKSLGSEGDSGTFSELLDNMKVDGWETTAKPFTVEQTLPPNLELHCENSLLLQENRVLDEHILTRNDNEPCLCANEIADLNLEVTSPKVSVLGFEKEKHLTVEESVLIGWRRSLRQTSSSANRNELFPSLHTSSCSFNTANFASIDLGKQVGDFKEGLTSCVHEKVTTKADAVSSDIALKTTSQLSLSCLGISLNNASESTNEGKDFSSDYVETLNISKDISSDIISEKDRPMVGACSSFNGCVRKTDAFEVATGLNKDNWKTNGRVSLSKEYELPTSRVEVTRSNNTLIIDMKNVDTQSHKPLIEITPLSDVASSSNSKSNFVELVSKADDQRLMNGRIDNVPSITYPNVDLRNQGVTSAERSPSKYVILTESASYSNPSLQESGVVVLTELKQGQFTTGASEGCSSPRCDNVDTKSASEFFNVTEKGSKDKTNNRCADAEREDGETIKNAVASTEALEKNTVGDEAKAGSKWQRIMRRRRGSLLKLQSKVQEKMTLGLETEYKTTSTRQQVQDNDKHDEGRGENEMNVYVDRDADDDLSEGLKMFKSRRRLSLMRFQSQMQKRVQKFEKERQKSSQKQLQENEGPQKEGMTNIVKLGEIQEKEASSLQDLFDNAISTSKESMLFLTPAVSRNGSIDSTSSMGTVTEDIFKVYERRNLDQQREMKRKFRGSISDAKKTLLEARIIAQEQTTAKRFQEASRKHKDLQKLRAARRDPEVVLALPSVDNKSSQLRVHGEKRFKDESVADTNKKKLNDLREIRKVQSELDRAKAKRLQTLLKLQTKSYLVEDPNIDPNIVKLRHKKDSERIERYEVECLISELRYLDMHEYAAHLSQALMRKDETEVQLKHGLRRERERMAELAKKQKLAEQARIREEEKQRKLAEKERLEREKKEREEKERQRRRDEAIKRRAHNLELWESYSKSILATEITRSFTFSYLPVLKKQPLVDIDDQNKCLANKLRKTKPRYIH